MVKIAQPVFMGLLIAYFKADSEMTQNQAYVFVACEEINYVDSI